METPKPLRSARRSRWWRWLLIWGTPAVLLLPLAAIAARPYVAHWTYRPREGDVVFQSLPASPLSTAIEGATNSPYSHCGLVARREGRWVVLEAYRGVEETPLGEWLARGQGGAFAVYRLRPPHGRHVAATIAHARGMLGRPYDPRYRWDDETIYCSELVFKAYQQASGRPLGRLVTLGDLRWQPFRSFIERVEGGAVPIEREMITPRDLAAARELELALRFGF
jgi:hypothetical protein